VGTRREHPALRGRRAEALSANGAPAIGTALRVMDAPRTR
jgi:hypothetical protein